MPEAARKVPHLELRVASKAFSRRDGGNAAILRDIRVSAGPGEALAVLGPSGIGKSTLLRIVLGLDRAFSGSVVRPLTRPGVMFAEPLLAPWLSVAGNLRLVAELSEARLASLLAEVELPASGALLPRQLSLGMARRVALARALAVAADWLVLDEPLASLDPGLASRLGAVIGRRVREDGALALLATHELGQALAFASRILVLAGRPACLAADLAVPPDASSRARLQQELQRRFPFLETAAIVGPPSAD